MQFIPPRHCLFCLAVPLASALAVGPPDPAPHQTRGSEWVERHAYQMGTVLGVRVAAASRDHGLLAIDEVFHHVARVDGILSTWRRDSEIALLNAAVPGEPVRASPQLFGFLLEARRWAAATGGAFDPAVGPLIDAWDLRGAGRRPSAQTLNAALEASGIARFALDPAHGTVTRPAAASWIDSGAFGKGAALRGAGHLLAERGITAALLDFGGQVLALGVPAGDGAWTVAVAHPVRRGEPAAILRLTDRSAATSGQSERWVEVDGERFGHVVDPRSGHPVRPWGSVTVVAPDPLTADVLSTALFVMGPEAGINWVHDAVPEVGVLVLVTDGGATRACWNAAMEAYLDRMRSAMHRRCHGGSER